MSCAKVSCSRVNISVIKHDLVNTSALTGTNSSSISDPFIVFNKHSSLGRYIYIYRPTHFMWVEVECHWPSTKVCHFWSLRVSLLTLTLYIDRCKRNAGPRNVSLLIPYLNTLKGHTFPGMKVHGPVEIGTQVRLYNGRHWEVDLYSWWLAFRLQILEQINIF